MKLPFFSTHTSRHCCSFPVIEFQFSRVPLFHSSSTSTARKPFRPRMDAAVCYCPHRRKDKVVVIMGATGAGKSRLSVDLATRYPFSEIINSDKMQVYRGLDITTNKIPVEERNGVAHHLLGVAGPDNGELTPSEFRSKAGAVIADISSRHKLPVIVGGSNSFIHALLVEEFDPEVDVFGMTSFKPISKELRHKCCFLWVDVLFPVLSEYLSKRVDNMLESGMVDELARFFDPVSDDLDDDSGQRFGLRKAIGVPEFDRYFKKYPPPAVELSGREGDMEDEGEYDQLRKGAYEEAVRAIKNNTCHLAKRQTTKILRLKAAGWDLHKLDATEAFRALLISQCSVNGGGERWSDIWKRHVLEPSVKIVKKFLME